MRYLYYTMNESVRYPGAYSTMDLGSENPWSVDTPKERKYDGTAAAKRKYRYR